MTLQQKKALRDTFRDTHDLLMDQQRYDEAALVLKTIRKMDADIAQEQAGDFEPSAETVEKAKALFKKVKP